MYFSKLLYTYLSKYILKKKLNIYIYIIDIHILMYMHYASFQNHGSKKSPHFKCNSILEELIFHCHDSGRKSVHGSNGSFTTKQLIDELFLCYSSEMECSAQKAAVRQLYFGQRWSIICATQPQQSDSIRQRCKCISNVLHTPNHNISPT